MATTMLNGGYSTARLSFGPVRTGRVVALQVVRSGVWTPVATTWQNSTGKASVTVTAGKPGSYSYRAWTAASSGAPAFASPTHTLVVTAQLVVSATSLATATAGASYTQSLTATGGTPGYTWSLASGSLPPGLSLSTLGQISGTPDTLGTSAFQIQARDVRGTTARASVTLVVAPGPASGLLGQIRPETIAAGGRHSCAVTTGGGVKCWGDNIYGQLGHGPTFDAGGMPVYLYNVPVDVVGLSAGAASVSAGGGHSCAVTTGGGVKCWGDNGDGELGDGTNTDSNVPVGVVGLDSGVASVSAGPFHTCAVTTSGAVKCWGLNSLGRLGNGNAANSAVPVDVVGLSSGVAAVAAGQEHSCAVTTSGAVKCWGYNLYGQLGNGNTSLPDHVSSVPVGVVGLASGVANVSVGYETSCAVTTSGALKCWGYNDYGQLGNGTTDRASTPADVTGLGFGVVSVSLGYVHGCAVTTSGTVKCWGEGATGQLGNSAPTSPFGIWSSVEPIDVTRLEPGITTVAAGGTHTCVLTTVGAMKCWGSDYRGQRGDGATDTGWISNPIPADVFGLGPGTVAVPAG
jgi:alpha-tubulin suppressor-like RCC1 family protein